MSGPLTHGARWRFAIDRGGTFTDVIAWDPDGRLHTAKLLSTAPGQYADAALEAIRRFTGTRAGAPLPAERIAEVRIGTTVATNALLEGKGARTVLVITAGFADQLVIGDQARPRLFALAISRPQPLFGLVIEAAERVTAEGEVLMPLDRDALAAALGNARQQGFTACAIALIHGWRYPEHERAAAALARAAGFTAIATSHDTDPLPKLVPRGRTTVADAALAAPLAAYAAQLSGALPGVRLMFMQSGGGLVGAQALRAKDAVLSGPAGGVYGMASTAAAAGFPRAIGFDMGGTSTDVARFDGTFDMAESATVAGHALRVPMLAIHTVAAGGGSILRYDGVRLTAGPDSAGADPGPACYGRGGPLTVTDANLMTGRLAPAFFPRVFGAKGTAPLDTEAARAGFHALARTHGLDPAILADGFLSVAVETMAAAIKTISIRRGYDPQDYALAVFGGAGGQLACRVADALGMRQVLVHPLAGLLSAYGIGLAPVRAERMAAVEVPLDRANLLPLVQALRAEAEAAISAQGIAPEAITTAVTVHLRAEGSDTALPAPLDTLEAMTASFAGAHHRLFGFAVPDVPLIVQAVGVAATAGHAVPDRHWQGGADSGPVDTTTLFAGGRWQPAPVHRWDALRRSTVITGPALIAGDGATVVVEPGWQAQLLAGGELLLERGDAAPARQIDPAAAADPVLTEIFAHAFMGIAEQMGATLERTAASVNIKERLDFSCALFDATGALVANAPHMPVHLGSMGDSVRAVIAKAREVAPGDAFALNAPYDGGTHLPDVTVVAPVFLPGEDHPRFWTAARGHHADLGGITPGSMPPFSTHIGEEGVLFEGEAIVRGGCFLEAEVRALLAQGDHPARNPGQNIRDLKAQVAACQRGSGELAALAAHWGAGTVTAYMRHCMDQAERAVRKAIATLSGGSFTVAMDDGAVIAVTVHIDPAAGTATVDFTGTSPQRPTNFNAPPSVVKAAVLYVFRCLAETDLPMNAGVLAPIRIAIPEGSMLSPRHPAAVVAGNVETSQAIVDALFGALGVMAAAQGTMNNLTFGDSAVQYYETLCGGAGAGPSFDGASAVHTHMTNSRLTDPEILEMRYPVLVETFAIRRGSGGAGRHPGGDGVIRRLRFRRAMEASILATRRSVAPFGLAGGADGLPGITRILRADGRSETLPHAGTATVNSGDAIEIHTPGGGGYGAAE